MTVRYWSAVVNVARANAVRGTGVEGWKTVTQDGYEGKAGPVVFNSDCKAEALH